MKLTIPQSHSLNAAIDQVCADELFSQASSTTECNTINVFKDRLSGNVHFYPHYKIHYVKIEKVKNFCRKTFAFRTCMR